MLEDASLSLDETMLESVILIEEVKDTVVVEDETAPNGNEMKVFVVFIFIHVEV